MVGSGLKAPFAQILTRVPKGWKFYTILSGQTSHVPFWEFFFRHFFSEYLLSLALLWCAFNVFKLFTSQINSLVILWSQLIGKWRYCGKCIILITPVFSGDGRYRLRQYWSNDVKVYSKLQKHKRWVLRALGSDCWPWWTVCGLRPSQSSSSGWWTNVVTVKVSMIPASYNWDKLDGYHPNYRLMISILALGFWQQWPPSVPVWHAG